MPRAKAQDTSAEMVEVRILHDCPFGLWGQVVEMPRELVAQAKRMGCVDDDPDAVAYAKQK